MSDKFEIYGSTKLSDILSVYPRLKQALPRVNEKFKLLSSPLGKVMLKTATIADISKRSGIEEKVMIDKLMSLIAAHA